jgi:hypothetical protein
VSKSKFLSAKAKTNPNDDGKKLKELDDTQASLRNVIVSFAKELKTMDIPATRTKADQERIQATLFSMADLAIKLNRLSLSEGAQVTATTAINLIFRQNDRINELFLQNAALNERLKKIEDQHGSLRKTDVSGDISGKGTT